MIKIFKGMSEMPPETFSARLSEADRTSASRLKAAQSVPAHVCNASSKALYTSPAWSASRPEGQAFLQIKSRGF